jgi:hypothetical protein
MPTFTFEHTLERDESDHEIVVTYSVGNDWVGDYQDIYVLVLSAEFTAPNKASIDPITDDEWDDLRDVCFERAQEDAADAAADEGDYRYELQRDMEHGL